MNKTKTGHRDGRRHHGLAALTAVASLLAACGGGGGGSGSGNNDGGGGGGGSVSTTQADAVRLAHQASFGPSEALVAQIRAAGPVAWLKQQLAMGGSRYSSGAGDAVHRNISQVFFCDIGAQKDNPNCWRDNFSTEPLGWDFYRNATQQPDQLRQRLAFALGNLLVVSGHEVSGTYGLRNYHNAFLEGAFGNYRDVLRKVAKSPVMGDYLGHVNNDPVSPNENFARELLQLFSLGTCMLNPDGSLVGGRCEPVYDNNRVRSYAYALTGWTYPAGGQTAWGCWPQGTNCQYYGGDMVAVPALRDTQPRELLQGLVVPAGTAAVPALETVLDSLMQHPNVGPFVARRLIQDLVMSDPEPAYVARVAAAFNSGRHTASDAAGSHSFGAGVKGDLAATVAAVLLDPVARNTATEPARGGHLRSPVLMFTGALRALDGHSDGAPFGWWWGQTLQQHVFMAPSVFSFYPPDYPVPGTQRVGPEFGIHSTNGALERMTFLTYLLEWDGSEPDAGIPGATGTKVSTAAFEAGADNADALVDRLANLLLGHPLAGASRDKVVTAVAFWTASNDAATWRTRRVRTAAYLLLASPAYQVQP